MVNRSGCGIENGNVRRLGVALDEDLCRVHNGKGQLVLGLFRCFGGNLSMEWRLQQPKPRHESLTDFQSLIGGNNLSRTMSLVASVRQKLRCAPHAYALSVPPPIITIMGKWCMGW